ncbi:hypothetical protein BF128_004564 [Escherichia coli]|nr:hypothetical protein [Escherichia coli]
MTPEERIKANVQAALGKQDKKPVKKQNLFVAGVCKSASRSRSTDLAEIVEICESLPVTNAECAALCLICCHNNTQVREKTIEDAGYEERGIITAEEMSIATGQEFTPTDFTLTILELTACNVLVLDDDGFYRVTLYAEE